MILILNVFGCGSGLREKLFFHELFTDNSTVKFVCGVTYSNFMTINFTFQEQKGFLTITIPKL